MQRRYVLLLALGIVNFFFIGACMANLFGKIELTPEWIERFTKVAKLNEYAQNHTVQLSDVVLTSYDLTGVKLNGATFENTEWRGAKFNKASLVNTQFKKTKLDGVKFQESVLSDVIFEDVELREVSFFKATLKHVKFIRCKFDAVTADRLKTSDVEFIDSTLVNSSFSEGQLVAVVKNSNLNDIEFTDLEIPSSLTFEKSELNEVDFSRSVLERLGLDHVKTSGDGGASGGRINFVEIRDSQFRLGFTGTQIDSFTVSKSTIESSLNSATIKDLDLTDCTGMKDMTLYMAKIGQMRIQNCHLNDFALVKAAVEEFSATNAQFTKSQFMNSKIKAMALENVLLDGKLDFTNAHIGQFTTKNVTKLPTLNLITTGSNVKLD